MTSFDDRYRALGIERNPFAAKGPEDDAALVFVDRGLPRPPPPGSCTLVQVIGEPGYGKSTQLREWRIAVPGPVHYIPRAPYRARWASPPRPEPQGILYGDEIDRMPRPLRRAWLRRCAAVDTTVVIGTHIDLTTLGTRCGFARVITHQLPPVDRSTLERVIDAKLASVSLAGAATVSLDGPEIDRILLESRGNLREAEVICHKVLARRT